MLKSGTGTYYIEVQITKLKAILTFLVLVNVADIEGVDLHSTEFPVFTQLGPNVVPHLTDEPLGQDVVEAHFRNDRLI